MSLGWVMHTLPDFKMGKIEIIIMRIFVCLISSLQCDATARKNYTIKPRTVLPMDYVKGKLTLFQF